MFAILDSSCIVFENFCTQIDQTTKSNWTRIFRTLLEKLFCKYVYSIVMLDNYLVNADKICYRFYSNKHEIENKLYSWRHNQFKKVYWVYLLLISVVYNNPLFINNLINTSLILTEYRCNLILKSLVVPVIWLALIGAIYSRIA